jgi:hypothetical protein
MTKNIMVFVNWFCEYRQNNNIFAELEPVLCSCARITQTIVPYPSFIYESVPVKSEFRNLIFYVFL